MACFPTLFKEVVIGIKHKSGSVNKPLWSIPATVG